MGRVLAWLGVFASVAALLAWNFYFKHRQDAAPVTAIERPLPTPEPVAPDLSEPAPDPEPEPLPEFIQAAPPSPDDTVVLPPLDDSDESVFAALQDQVPPGALAGLLADRSIIRKIVVTVDNLPRQKVSMKIRALNATPERFVVAGNDDDLTLDPDNYRRYARFIGLLDAFAPDAAVDLYVMYYPLLQEAYEGLGFPGEQFHGRVGEVIDHLLDTPEISGPLQLERPHVLYRYADPRIESLSAGQKTLIRMGGDNSDRAKDWLRRFRDLLETREIS